jgi:VanZ family protein
MRKRSRGGIAWLAVAGWLAAIFAASSVPATRAPAVPRTVPATGIPTDKVAHVAEFAVLSLLIARALLYDDRPMRPASAAFAATLAGTAFGALDELHQRSVDGREAAWDDVAADAAGAVLGALVASRLSSRSSRFRAPRPASRQTRLR